MCLSFYGVHDFTIGFKNENVKTNTTLWLSSTWNDCKDKIPSRRHAARPLFIIQLKKI